MNTKTLGVGLGIVGLVLGGYGLIKHFSGRDNIVWEFPSAGIFEREFPSDANVVILLELDPRDIPEEIHILWWAGPEGWVSWKPSTGAGLLVRLLPGETYTVTVTGECTWLLPRIILVA